MSGGGTPRDGDATSGPGVEAPPAGPPRLVTVVVPARDEEDLICDQLDALERQTYDQDWELLVVDDGSRDRTRELALDRRGVIPGLRVETTARAGINHARNTGARLANGELLAFCDADDVVEPGWLTALVEASSSAHIVGGPLDHTALNDSPLLVSWMPTELNTELLAEGFFLVHAPGGNCAVWTDVARAVGWDDSFRFAGSDLEFCWRAQLRGYTMAFAPGAVVQRRLRPDSLRLARQYFRYGAVFPRLYTIFRDEGMPGPDHDHARRAWRWLARHAPMTLSSEGVRGDWLRKAAFRVGRLAGSARHGVLFP